MINHKIKNYGNQAYGFTGWVGDYELKSNREKKKIASFGCIGKSTNKNKIMNKSVIQYAWMV